MNRTLNQDYQADILVVETQPDDLRLLSSLLMKQGYQVRQALDGEMALLAVETIPPDLILLNLNLSPPLNGYEVCQRLKATDSTCDIPIIAVSELAAKHEQLEAFKTGAIDCVAKPYQFEEMLVRIETHLTNSWRYKQLKAQNFQLQRQIHLIETAQTSPINLHLLNQAIAATKNGILITDATELDHPIIYVNPGFEQITGYVFEEVVGKNCRFLQGEDRDQVGIAQIRQAVLAEKECRVILRNYRRDGTLFWNEISISPVRDKSGMVTHFIGLQTDITERKRTEEERQRYQSSLQQMNRELHRLNDVLHRLANLDGLTGVANRRCFDDHFCQEWRRLAREKLPLSLILLDIDYFKGYNDTYGHLDGDDCLKAVAGAMSQVIHRPADLVARFGGEEFAVILPNTPAGGAMRVAQAIRDEVHKLQIAHQASSVSDYVTLSLGVATQIPSLDFSPDDLIVAADRALYNAKAQGRDRAIFNSEF